MNHKKIYAMLTMVGVVMGFLIALQARSYARVTELVARDSNPSDVLREIYSLKLANESLNQEILALEEQLAQYQDQASAYDALVAEIEKNEILIGGKPIQGPGIRLSIDAPLTVESMVDLTNELWGAHAEAVSVQGIRLVDETDGYYAINEWVVLQGTVLERPYEVEAIGDASIMSEILNQPGTILSRLKSEYGDASVQLQTASLIQMEATATQL